MKVAVILDDFSRMAFKYEWNQIEFGLRDWPEIFAENRPELLFVESAWHGNQGRWRYQMTGNNAPKPELRALIDWCRAEGIPTIFWNKEDPPNFDFFIDTAKLFDHVFTCDGDMVPATARCWDTTGSTSCSSRPSPGCTTRSRRSADGCTTWSSRACTSGTSTRSAASRWRPSSPRSASSACTSSPATAPWTRSTPGPPSTSRTSWASSPTTRCWPRTRCTRSSST
ncbi:hypothetical protein ACFQX6_39925 [Streptosporangium lutulentum]